MNALVASTQTNGMPMDVEMDSELLDQLGWRSAWFDLSAKLQEELQRMRHVRPLLPLLADERLDPDAIADLRVSIPPPQRNAREPVRPISIPARPRLVSAEIGCEFQLTNDQLMNIQTVARLIIKSAQQVALAEDALLLLGNDLVDEGELESGAAAIETRDRFLRLSIEHRNLDQQKHKLLRRTLLLCARVDIKANLEETQHAHLTQWLKDAVVNRDDDSVDPAGKIRSALEDLLQGAYSEDEDLERRLRTAVIKVSPDSAEQKCFGYPTIKKPEEMLQIVLQGISDLQERGHYGEYCALVHPDLYQAAYKPKGQDYSSTPIYQIMPRLREGGFGYSPMLPRGSGIMWSTGGGALGVVVPREAHVVFIRKDRDVILSVQERIRLVMNEPRAVVQLRDPDTREPVS